MNVIKLMLIIGAIFGLLAFAAAPAMAQFDKVWAPDPGGNNLWATDLNWFPPGKPAATDTVHIGNGFDTFFVEISSADAACKTIDIDAPNTLTIQGKSLTLGDPDADTTSDLEEEGFKEIPGTIRLWGDAGGAPGVLILHRWVTFQGGGVISGKSGGGGPNQVGNGVVKRAGGPNDKGIILPSGSTVRFVGTINVMCDFDHQGGGLVGTDRCEQTMTFGPNFDDIAYREPFIKGSGTITASSGTVRFSVVDFDAANAPDWEIAVGTIQLTSDADSSHYTNESFSIAKAGIVNGGGTGTLDLDHSLATTGALSVITSSPSTGKMIIEVASGTVFSVMPAAP